MTDSTSPVPLQLVGLCGSLRAGSLNRAALHAVAGLMPPAQTLQLLDYRDVPVFDADDQARGWPPAVLAVAEALRTADGVVMASPEYNFSLPGGFKNLLDWLSRLPDQPLKHKPVAILGAGTGPLGTARMQYELRRVLHCLEAQVLLKPEIFIGMANTKFDAAGQLTDEPTRALLKLQLSAFEALILQHRRSRANAA